RNLILANDPDILLDIIVAGALSQVTTHSLNGLFGRKIRKVALDMCRRNLVHIVASDAHNQDQRPFDMREAYSFLSNKLDSTYVQYYQENAEAVVNNGRIEKREPKQVSRRWWVRNA